MDTLKYILEKFNLHPTKMPVEIPNIGRNNLPVLMSELGFKVGAEIGVLEGAYSEILLKNMPGLKLYAIDSWLNYPDYHKLLPQSGFDDAYAKTKKRLKGYDVKFIRKFSMDAVKDFKDESLDFVYIDASHEFSHVAEDMVYWSKKVRSGGIVAGHDYRPSKRRDGENAVIPAVLGYMNAYAIWPWFLLGTKAMLPNEIRDRYRTWMFVKS